jgi:hypothetical protein
MQSNHLLNGRIGRVMAKLGYKSTNSPVLTGLRVMLEPSRLYLWSELRAVRLEERVRQAQTPVLRGQSRPERALYVTQPGVQGVAGKFSHQRLSDLFGGIEQARGDDGAKAIVRFVQAGREHPQVLELIAQQPVSDLLAFTMGSFEFGAAWTSNQVSDACEPTSSLDFQVCLNINVPIHEHHPFNVQDFAPGPIAGDDPKGKLLEDFLLHPTAVVVNFERHSAPVVEKIRHDARSIRINSPARASGIDYSRNAKAVAGNHNQPFSRAIRAASMRLSAPSLLIASER